MVGEYLRAVLSLFAAVFDNRPFKERSKKSRKVSRKGLEFCVKRVYNMCIKERGEDMKLDELRKELNLLNGRVKEVLKKSGYEDYGDVEVDFNPDNPDEVQLAVEYRSIVGKLDELSHALSYFMRPVAREGKLYMNQNGRYELDGKELTSGSGVEVLLYDECMERWEWYASRIESKPDGAYYLVGKSTLNLEGVTARQRERGL